MHSIIYYLLLLLTNCTVAKGRIIKLPRITRGTQTNRSHSLYALRDVAEALATRVKRRVQHVDAVQCRALTTRSEDL